MSMRQHSRTTGPGRAVPSGRQAKREAVLAAALDLFVRKGFSKTSMDEIALKGGVARQTIYNHFSGKEEVFKALAGSFADRVTGPLPEAARSSDLRSTLVDLGLRTRSLLLAPSSLALHRLLICEAPKFPDLAMAVYEAGPQRSMSRLARHLRSNSAKPLSQAQAMRAAEQFFGMILGRSQLRALLGIAQPSECERKVVEEAVDVFLTAWSFPSVFGPPSTPPP